mgnify:CR=1 FL=1
MKEYFICNGNKYVIEDNNIYKVFNKQLITPNIDELKKVKKLIKNKDKDVFSSSKLNEIAKKNKELYKIDILPDILERMEKFIKDENIELFYKNLETVKFEFDDPIECIDSNNEHENGFHDAMTNIIHINADTFDCLRNFSKDNDLDFDIVWKIALAHELFHMASCNNLYYETGYIYKGLVAFDVDVVNENNKSLSGGERAEYNLIKEIKNAEQYDILLLDEPEASFDNPFINSYIIDLIKDISKKTTVFITTHNNSLGILMNPNKIIYTANESGDYKVYTGEIGSKEFKTINNDSIIGYDTIMEVMEAGEKAYNERSNIYESFKN